ncbi:MAG: hypothetical protein HYV93_14365 [Candidatus Rokubacteria bacterium]|nr:hypothetical protein [Candidatus Rokubacteria bacterium]
MRLQAGGNNCPATGERLTRLPASKAQQGEDFRGPAITGEFVGARRGIGLLLLERSHTLDTAGVFALLTVLGVVGTALHAGLVLVRQKVLFWSPSVRGQVSA